MSRHHEVLAAVKAVIPCLQSTLHKGQAGRIAVIGGGDDYTGAPYLSAMAALRAGADLAYVLCSAAAAVPLKSYSCELIVHPVLDDEASAVRQLTELAPRLSAVVIGPGLGRQPQIQRTAVALLETLRRLSFTAVVIDADALWAVNDKPELVAALSGAVLTPNAVEFMRLYRSVMQQDLPSDSADLVSSVQQLSQKLNGIAVLRKGANDIVACGDSVLTSEEEGSWRRSGGQGDVLSGVTALVLHWAQSNNRNSTFNSQILAAYGASAITRRASQLAFAVKGRSMLASDMLDFIHPAFQQLFGSH